MWNSILLKLKPFNTKSAILSKKEFMLDTSVEALKMQYIYKNAFSVEASFQ